MMYKNKDSFHNVDYTSISDVLGCSLDIQFGKRAKT